MITIETTTVLKTSQLVSVCNYIHEVGQYSRRLPCNKKPSVQATLRPLATSQGHRRTKFTRMSQFAM